MKIFLLLAACLFPFTARSATTATPVNRADVQNLADYLLTTSTTMEEVARARHYREAADWIRQVKMASRRLKAASGPNEDSPYWAARYVNEIIHGYVRAREAIVREADAADAAFIRGNLSSVIDNLILEFDEAPNVRHVLGMNDGFGYLPYRAYVWTE